MEKLTSDYNEECKYYDPQTGGCKLATQYLGQLGSLGKHALVDSKQMHTAPNSAQEKVAFDQFLEQIGLFQDKVFNAHSELCPGTCLESVTDKYSTGF